MSCDNPTDRESRGPESPAAQDAATERLVLHLVLDQHPDQLTAAEIRRALYSEPETFEANDAVARAVRDLIAAGLLRQQGEAVVPTVAALHFYRLEEE